MIFQRYKKTNIYLKTTVVSITLNLHKSQFLHLLTYGFFQVFIKVWIRLGARSSICASKLALRALSELTSLNDPVQPHLIPPHGSEGSVSAQPEAISPGSGAVGCWLLAHSQPCLDVLTCG